jgi:ferredoxin
MILVNEGELPIGDGFVDHIDKCLDCRSCETACPSAVEYGKLVEYARARIEQEYRRPFLTRLTRDFVFNKLLPYPRRIAFVANLLRIYQQSGMQAIARATGLLKLMGLAEREWLLPPIDDHFFFEQLGKTYPALGPRRARRVLRWMRCERHLHQTKRSHHPRAHGQRLRSCGSARATLLRGARRSCGRSRSGTFAGQKEFRSIWQERF